MLSLTGRSILWLATLAAIALPIITIVTWNRGISRRVANRPHRVLARVAMIVTSQLLAVSALFLYVNDQYVFYTSWADLLGKTTQVAPVQTNATLIPGDGKIETFVVHGSVAKGGGLVWLPPQYNDPAYSTTKFPVVMFMPGQPSTPASVFRQFSFGSIASRAIRDGKLKPFVAVFPPIVIAPPRDTECTNVPGGPQAETWLAKDIPTGLVKKYRVQPPGRGWSVMGWSTGGFCAAKLILKHPKQFSSAVSFGGYFTPLTDSTTGDLFGGNPHVRDQNSPLWLYQHTGLGSNQLLMISGRQDVESWASAGKMLKAAAGDPSVSYIAFPTGGHNYRNYRAYLLPALSWVAKAGTGL